MSHVASDGPPHERRPEKHASPAVAGAPSRPTRDPRIDTAKGVLIVLVVLGHLLEAIDHWQAGAARVPLVLVYAFHMPAFVFLAGVTASRTDPWRRVATVLLLLVLFQPIYFAEWSLIESGKSFSWSEPFWILWFLLAMAWWQALAPAIARHPRAALALSFAAALGAGTVAAIGSPLALSRTLVFRPFFVLGMGWGGALIERASRAGRGTRLALLAACAAAAAALLGADIGRGWLYASSGYDTLGVGPLEGMATRAALLGVAALATYTLLAWLPDTDTGGVTTAGRRSLGIYLLHGLVVMMLTPTLADVLDAHGALAAWALCAVVVVGIVSLLATPAPDRWLRAVPAALIARGRRLLGREGVRRGR